ncbi:MAG: L-ascorbate metabolism protein UlaG (beta-lactamase superfamily) [Cognaticolwellia sp.]
MKRLLQALGLLITLPVGGLSLAWWTATPDIGAVPSGARLERIDTSSQWNGEAFTNRLTQVGGPASEMFRKQFASVPAQRPTDPLTVHQIPQGALDELPESGLRVTWFGHSTMLVDIDGVRVLIDPVWSERTAPWTKIGPTRFADPPMALEDLPPVDVIIISHDHYDHLDVSVVQAMADQDLQWVVPLGVGAHLEYWGVLPDRITELDWWEDTQVNGLTLTATPSRHFSGRWLDRMASTLWAGWALRGSNHAVFYSGDTSLFPELEDIGERLGPFDLTMIEAGAYDSSWTDVHLGPEQAVIAHQMVQGGVLLPVHWGMFDLANHGWTEPAERVISAAARQGVPVLSPMPGGSVELSDVGSTPKWWPDAPAASVAEEPVWSTSVDAELEKWWGTR